MWWREVQDLGARITSMFPNMETTIPADALIEPGAVLDDTTGPIVIGSGTRVCTGSVLRGPLVVGIHCLFNLVAKITNGTP